MYPGHVSLLNVLDKIKIRVKSNLQLTSNFSTKVNTKPHKVPQMIQKMTKNGVHVQLSMCVKSGIHDAYNFTTVHL